MAAQLPRPWFRLGSITRPAPATTTTAPVTEQPRPPPALVRPPMIRPAAQTESSEPTSLPQSAKSPPAPAPASSLPRPTTSIPSSPTLTPPAKKAASPAATTFTRPVFPSPSPSNGQRGGGSATSAHSSQPQKAAASPSPVAMPTTAKPSPPVSASDSKPRTSLPPSPTNSDSPITTTFAARSPLQSPTIPHHSIPALPSPYQSPKPKPATASPPSPLVLPPSQLQSVGQPKHESIPQEVEQKAVVVQKVVDKPPQSDHHLASYNPHNPVSGQNGKQEPHRDDDQGKYKGMRAKKAFGSDQETNTKVITMAGENRGAFMEVILSDKNNRHHQIRRNSNEISENESGSLNNGDKSKKSMGVHGSLPIKAFFNSNVQGINNSILLDSTFTHHDPGIHLVLSRIPSSADDLKNGQL